MRRCGWLASDWLPCLGAEEEFKEAEDQARREAEEAERIAAIPPVGNRRLKCMPTPRGAPTKEVLDQLLLWKEDRSSTIALGSADMEFCRDWLFAFLGRQEYGTAYARRVIGLWNTVSTARKWLFQHLNRTSLELDDKPYYASDVDE